MTNDSRSMLSIWFFVSIVLGVYGLLVTAVGLYYAANPAAQGGALARLNPSLWWGIVMLVAAGLLFIADRAGRKKG